MSLHLLRPSNALSEFRATAMQLLLAMRQAYTSNSGGFRSFLSRGDERCTCTLWDRSPTDAMEVSFGSHNLRAQKWLLCSER